MNRVEFLLEIGFEEMPAPWLPRLADELRARFDSLAADLQLDAKDVRSYWTSRRLVLAADLIARQSDRSVVEWGPAAKIAKDASGGWTKAAEGFAKKQGVPLDALALAPKVEGSPDLYLSAKKQIIGREAKAVLAELIAPLLRGLNFPKRMNWDAWLEDGKGAFPFGRPIRWLVALCGGDVVPFTIYGVSNGAKGSPILSSGNCSTGHRFYPRGASDRTFVVGSFADLSKGLEERFVVLDPAARASRIAEQLKAAGAVDGSHSDLAHEWVGLVEYPTLAIGSVPKQFADLPGFVVETVLAHHQKAIVLHRGADGSTPFAVITGGDPAAAKNAAAGQEGVVSARLKDARFFLEEDSKKPFADRVADLDAITFHKGLGSYGDKARRIEKLATVLARAAGASEAVAGFSARAALLAKADLGTLMVREFTELQGAIGGLYAKSEDPAVASAVRHHYQPVSVERGSVPDSLLAGDARSVFAFVSAADKIDTLVGYFGLGLIPSGSSDPFGLRRAGQGVVRVLLDFWPGAAPDLDEIVRAAYSSYSVKLPKTSEECVVSVCAFLAERLRHVLVARGGAQDEVDAVLGARRGPLDDPRDTESRLEALHAVRADSREAFAALGEAFKRAKNILGESTDGPRETSADLFQDEAERALHEGIAAAEKTSAADARGRLLAIAALRDRVDAFFKHVMVNAEDAAVRANRHALLRRLLDLVYDIADLSRLA